MRHRAGVCVRDRKAVSNTTHFSCLCEDSKWFHTIRKNYMANTGNITK